MEPTDTPAPELWKDLPALAQQFEGRLIAGVFDPIVQLERSFSAALRHSGLPVLCLPPERAPLLRTLCRELPLGVVVALWRTREVIEPLRPELPGAFVEYLLVPGEEPEALPNTGFTYLPRP